MPLLEELQAGQRLSGVIPGAIVEVVSVEMHGLIRPRSSFDNGRLARRTGAAATAEAELEIVEKSARPFDADATDFKLVAECPADQARRPVRPDARGHDVSDIQPLPHQIRAVYGELLPRTPLRFLLADDPGAGKTIMAGLYIKELILREDVKRCLIVAPGGLVEQWQDELYLKFGLALRDLQPRAQRDGLRRARPSSSTRC